MPQVTKVKRHLDKVLQWKISVMAYGDARAHTAERRYPQIHICGFDGPEGAAHGELASLAFDPHSVEELVSALRQAAAKALAEPDADYDFEVALQRTEPGDE